MWGKDFISNKSEWKDKEHRLTKSQDFGVHCCNYSLWSELQTIKMARAALNAVTHIIKRKYRIKGTEREYGL